MAFFVLRQGSDFSFWSLGGHVMWGGILFRTRSSGRATRALGIAALALALLVAPTSPAGAAGPESAAAPQVTVGQVAGHDGDGNPSTLSACPIAKYGYTGYRICEFSYSYIDRGNGYVEWFVVGTNFAIYHIWPASAGWQSLGGQARTALPNGVISYDDGVMTIGLNNLWYCRDWPWSSAWAPC